MFAIAQHTAACTAIQFDGVACQSAVIVNDSLNSIVHLHIKASHMHEFAFQVGLLGCRARQHRLPRFKSVHTCFVINGVPSVASTAPSEVEVIEPCRSLVTIEHHCMSPIVVSSRIEHGTTTRQIVVYQRLPPCLRVIPFSTIVVRQVELAVHSCSHLVGVASRGRSVLIAITQMGTGAESIHQHSHSRVLRCRARA